MIVTTSVQKCTSPTQTSKSNSSFWFREIVSLVSLLVSLFAVNCKTWHLLVMRDKEFYQRSIPDADSRVTSFLNKTWVTTHSILRLSRMPVIQIKYRVLRRLLDKIGHQFLIAVDLQDVVQFWRKCDMISCDFLFLLCIPFSRVCQSKVTVIRMTEEIDLLLHNVSWHFKRERERERLSLSVCKCKERRLNLVTLLVRHDIRSLVHSESIFLCNLSRLHVSIVYHVSWK